MKNGVPVGCLDKMEHKDIMKMIIIIILVRKIL